MIPLSRSPGAALALGAALLLAGCPSAESTTVAVAAEPSSITSYDANAIPVRIAKASRGQLVRTLELGGVAEAWRAARLAPSAQGVVDVLNVELGSEVKRGQLLAAIDTTTLGLQLEATRRATDLARLQLKDAESEAARAGQLAASGAITSRDGDKAELGLELARAQLAQAQAQSAALEGQIKLARVIAPFDGRVTGLQIEKGEFFAGMGGMGGPPMLVELQALDVIRVDVNLAESDLSRVSEGMAVELVSDAFAGRSFAGEVTLVNAAATQGARTFLVRIKVPNVDSVLRPGMFLRARLAVDTRDDVVYVPARSITEHDGAWYVMVLDGEKARRQPVTPGLLGDQGWEVGGLEAGAQVVVEGHFGLPDGSIVRVIGGGA